MVKDSFTEKGLEYEILGIHWRGGEEETVVAMNLLEGKLEDIYRSIFSGFYDALDCNPPIVLHRLVIEECMNKNDSSGERLRRMNYINSVFETLERENNHFKIFDPRRYPNYDEKAVGSALFKEDLVHFTSDVNRWVAETILKDYQEKG